MTLSLDRRAFLGVAGATAALPVVAGATTAEAADPLAIADEGWTLSIDREAPYADDVIHLPGRFDLAKLPVNPPTGGWAALRPATSAIPCCSACRICGRLQVNALRLGPESCPCWSSFPAAGAARSPG